jgi:hypothetical protein
VQRLEVIQRHGNLVLCDCIPLHGAFVSSDEVSNEQSLPLDRKTLKLTRSLTSSCTVRETLKSRAVSRSASSAIVEGDEEGEGEGEGGLGSFESEGGRARV